MYDLSETELKGVYGEGEMKQEDYEFYKDEIKEIRKKETGILLMWIVPDEDQGHIEYKTFKTWTDMGIWENQI